MALLLLPVFAIAFLVVGAALLRAAVSLANRFLAPIQVVQDATDYHSPLAASDESLADESNPYASPLGDLAPEQTGSTPALPVPSMVYASGIILVQALLTGMWRVLIDGIVDPPASMAIVVAVGNLFIGFLIASAVYRTMLPTSFGKAMLVYLINILLITVIAVVVGGVVFVFTTFSV